MRSEPKRVVAVAKHPLDPQMNYQIIATEWSDETFTLTVANEAEVLAKGNDWSWDYLPSDYEVLRAISDALIERALESGRPLVRLGPIAAPLATRSPGALKGRIAFFDETEIDAEIQSESC